MKNIEIDVHEADPGHRLDQFLSAQAMVQAESLSRTRIQALIEAGHVTFDGEKATQAKAKIRAGQLIAIELPDAAPAEPKGEDIPLNIALRRRPYRRRRQTRGSGCSSRSCGK